MIEIKGISKAFGQVQALDGVSITLKGPGIYALLGNNGAGKTTLLNILTGRLPADEGTVTLSGAPVWENDSALGQFFMLGEKNLYPDDMRVGQAIKTSAQFYPNFQMEKALMLAERFGLPLRRKITALSTGYRSIFRIVLALSAGAAYLFLDEPVLGLDAQHRDLFYRLLIELYAKEPCCILLSTHLIQEAAHFVEHAFILQKGRLIKDAPVEELLGGVHLVSGPIGAVDGYLAGRVALSETCMGGLKTAYVEGAAPGECPDGLEIARPDLQEYFIALMGKEAAL